MEKDINKKPVANQDVNASVNPKSKSTDKSSATYKVGDAIEHAGDALEEKGAGRIGKKIHDIGDSIEHMDDK